MDAPSSWMLIQQHLVAGLLLPITQFQHTDMSRMDLITTLDFTFKYDQIKGEISCTPRPHANCHNSFYHHPIPAHRDRTQISIIPLTTTPFQHTDTSTGSRMIFFLSHHHIEFHLGPWIDQRDKFSGQFQWRTWKVDRMKDSRRTRSTQAVPGPARCKSATTATLSSSDSMGKISHPDPNPDPVTSGPSHQGSIMPSCTTIRIPVTKHSTAQIRNPTCAIAANRSSFRVLGFDLQECERGVVDFGSRKCTF